MKRLFANVLLIAVLLSATVSVSAGAPSPAIGIDVVLNTDINDALLADLGQHGTVLDVLYEIRALTMRARSSELAAIGALPYVAAADADGEAKWDPPWRWDVEEDMAGGISTWDLDAINVTDYGVGRTIGYDGSGVYVAVLDTGLSYLWRSYFPEGRIAQEYAIAFGGGGGEKGWVSQQPEKWEHDRIGHGTNVTSTILGYSFLGTAVNGVAPMATVIPVMVLPNGRGWWSMIARGVVYVGNLKAGPLADHPVVINMSLGGPQMNAMLQAAIDYALSQGVIVVASAGNSGEGGMGYPGAYAPVISVAASGWVGQLVPDWWSFWARDVPDPTNLDEYYIADFSSRGLPGQDLDVAAPGYLVFGPWSGRGWPVYGWGVGTSMASPHVAGIVALMAQKYPALTASQAEAILEASATVLPPGCRTAMAYQGYLQEFCWGADATGAGLATAEAALALTP